jgi:hypothetical protein
MYISIKEMVTGRLSEKKTGSKNQKTCGFPHLVTEYRRLSRTGNALFKCNYDFNA